VGPKSGRGAHPETEAEKDRFFNHKFDGTGARLLEEIFDVFRLELSRGTAGIGKCQQLWDR
jgi:MoxR-like ATPase